MNTDVVIDMRSVRQQINTVANVSFGCSLHSKSKKGFGKHSTICHLHE